MHFPCWLHAKLRAPGTHPSQSRALGRCPRSEPQWRVEQANKKERDRAKAARKEARKLAAMPVPLLTADPRPRECVDARESAEVDEWRAARRANFPTAENVARKLREAEERRAHGARRMSCSYR
jgi:Nuclear fragile X mental retardation-interacting protein 1 (NUFIP1)